MPGADVQDVEFLTLHICHGFHDAWTSEVDLTCRLVCEKMPEPIRGWAVMLRATCLTGWPCASTLLAREDAQGQRPRRQVLAGMTAHPTNWLRQSFHRPSDMVQVHLTSPCDHETHGKCEASGNSTVLIIGAGIAGLTTSHLSAAVKQSASSTGLDAEESNTRYAQGGIIWWGEEDSPSFSAAYRRAGDEVGRKAPSAFWPKKCRWLNPSDPPPEGPLRSDDSGHIHRTAEPRHSRPLIIHGTDQTGAAIQTALTQEATSYRISKC